MVLEGVSAHKKRRLWAPFSFSQPLLFLFGSYLLQFLCPCLTDRLGLCLQHRVRGH